MPVPDRPRADRVGGHDLVAEPGPRTREALPADKRMEHIDD